MFDYNSIVNKTVKTHGVEYTTSRFSPVEDECAKTAFGRMHPEELALLKRVAGEGVEIILQKPDDLMNGQFGLDTKGNALLTLSVSPGGKIARGIVVHEATHYDQWARGDLKIVNESEVLWKGESWKLARMGGSEYLNLPWEKEAFENQADFMGRTGKMPKALIKAYWAFDIGVMHDVMHSNVFKQWWSPLIKLVPMIALFLTLAPISGDEVTSSLYAYSTIVGGTLGYISYKAIEKSVKLFREKKRVPAVAR